MSKALTDTNAEPLPLPKDWSATVRNTVLNVIGLVRIAMLAGREALIQEGDVKDARIHQLESDLAMTREELRLLGTVKELLRQITVPEDQTAFERELRLIVDWYNEHRPHDTLGGKTPNEVYFSRPPANQQPRYEPREHWPRGSPCAKPQVGVEGDPGNPVIFEIDCHKGRRHLPIIRARQAA